MQNAKLAKFPRQRGDFNRDLDILSFERTDAVFTYLGDGSLSPTSRTTDWDAELARRGASVRDERAVGDHDDWIGLFLGGAGGFCVGLAH